MGNILRGIQEYSECYVRRIVLFASCRRGNGGSEQRSFLKATFQVIGITGDHMQTSGPHIIKLHFPYILLSHFALNKKARKFPCLKCCPGFRLPFVQDFIFSFLCKLLQLSTYPVIFSKGKRNNSFLGLTLFF